MAADNSSSLIGTLLTWLVVAVVAIVAIKVVFWLLGMAIGISVMLITLAVHLLPLVLLGWLVMKLFRGFSRSRDEELDPI
jgi:hypothetical protein